MPSLASGSIVDLFFPVDSETSITVTAPGRVSINGRKRDGSAITPRELYASETISVAAGGSLTIEAIITACDYTDPVSVGGDAEGTDTGYTAAATGIALTAEHLQYHDIYRVLGSGNVVIDVSAAQSGKVRGFMPDAAGSFTVVPHTNFDSGDWIVEAGASASSATAAGGLVTIVCQDGGVMRVTSPQSYPSMSVTEATPYVSITATGTVVSGACELAGYDCTVAAGNITIYDGTSTSGTVIVSTTALSVGRVEFAYKRALTVGCHVVLSGAATVNVLVG